MTEKVNMHSSESDNSGPDIGIDGEENETLEAADTPVEIPAGASAQDEAVLKAARAEAAEWQERFLRKAAEFENYRKRMDKEKSDSIMLAKSSLLMEFLPVADACERALQSMEKAMGGSGDLDRYREGVELLYKQLLDTFGRSGVVPIETEGKLFDPHLHEALSRKEDADCEEDMVVQELRRGYLFKDRLLRPAQVIVAVPSDIKTRES